MLGYGLEMRARRRRTDREGRALQIDISFCLNEKKEKYVPF
jgi:hypothetical protein